MLQFISGIEFSILELVVSLNNTLQSQDQNNQAYIGGLQNSVYLRQLLNLIDIILNAQMLGGLCQNSTVPTDAELQSLFEQVKTNLGNGTSTGTANGSNNLTVTNDTLRNQFDQCLSKVPQEKVEEVMAWIEQLTGAAQ
jgi:restriction endonuclease